jgi:hypothetical protein
MALLDINKNPTRKDVLVFGLSLPAFFGVVAYLVFAKAQSPGGAQAIGIAGALATALFVFVAPLRRPFFLAWMYLLSRSAGRSRTSSWRRSISSSLPRRGCS